MVDGRFRDRKTTLESDYETVESDYNVAMQVTLELCKKNQAKNDFHGYIMQYYLDLSRLHRSAQNVLETRGHRAGDSSIFQLFSFLFSHIRLRESLRKDRGCLAEEQTPKTGGLGRAHFFFFVFLLLIC